MTCPICGANECSCHDRLAPFFGESEPPANEPASVPETPVIWEPVPAGETMDGDNDNKP